MQISQRLDVFGFIKNGLKAIGIFSMQRIHIAIFGEVGSGKSETIKLLMSQNITRNEGCLLLDPHGDLAHDMLRLVPKKHWDRVVFISPSTILKFGKTVRINPLQVKKESDRLMVASSFVDALKQLYRESWGDRLETIIRNGCNALVEIEDATLGDLRLLVSDDTARDRLLAQVTNKDTKSFWTHTYKQYSKEAGSAAYNKLDKILATPQIAAMLDTVESSIDFAELLNSNKIVIVDLASGSSDDITEFLGSTILHMFYVEAKKRVDIPKDQRIPFFIYIDEAHRFSAFALREILNTMRKFNVKVAIASQTINAFPKKVADEFSALVKTIICFKCDDNTISSFRNLLPTNVEQQTQMSLHNFAFYSQNKPPIQGIGSTTPIKSDEDWVPLAKFSLDKHGEAVSLKQYMPVLKHKSEHPDISSCESAVLLLIHNSNLALTKEEIHVKLFEKFGVDQRPVVEAIENLTRLRMLERKIDSEGNKNIQRFALSTLAYNTHFSTVAMGRRAGSTLHLGAIFAIRKIMQTQFKYCIVDLGDQGVQRPDLLIYEPATFKDSEERTRYDITTWNDVSYAVEVETDPTKHPTQIIENFNKNYDKGYKVWFVVFSERHRQYIHDTLDNVKIESDMYDTIIMNEKMVLETYEKIHNVSSTHISPFEAQVLELLNQNPRNAESMAQKMPVSVTGALGIIKDLQSKGLVKTFSTVKTRHVTYLDKGKTEVFRKKAPYAELSEKGEDALGIEKEDPETPAPTHAEEFKEEVPDNTDIGIIDQFIHKLSNSELAEHLEDPKVSEKVKYQILWYLDEEGYKVITGKNGKKRVVKKTKK